jgi:cobalt-zinc-cadmium efflux system membrane fusion protein
MIERNSMGLAGLSTLAVLLTMTACKSEKVTGDGAPPTATQITNTGDMSLVSVDKPDQFPLIAAASYDKAAQLSATGAVFPDIAREVPVISLASGRVVDIKARLDDHVKKGQLLLKVESPDATIAFDAYLKAVNDEQLARKAYVRAQDLYKHGAISQAMLEAAEDTEKDAQADLKAAEEQLKTMGVDKDHPSPIVPEIGEYTGTIVAQNVTNAAAAGVTYSGSATAFTVADLSMVWVICDVWENDIPKIALGQEARIKLEAYPDHPITGRVSDIGPVLDPTLRTAKVRIEVPNPHELLKLGMFTTAVFTARTKDHYAIVPAPSVLHLHDRDWVFVPAGGNKFRRVEVKTGDIIDGNQVILSGISVGQQVVSNVLQLETTLEAQ